MAAPIIRTGTMISDKGEKFWLMVFAVIVTILFVLAAYGCYFNPTPFET